MAQLDSHLAALIESAPGFTPQAWFDRELNRLIYLHEECSYRQDPIDPHLTLLRHPTRDAIIGVVVENVSSLFDNLVAQRSANGQSGDLPLAELVKSAVVKDGRDCTDDRYVSAIAVVADTSIARDLALIDHPA